MATLQNIIRETTNGVLLKMQDTFELGDDRMYYEKEYGNAVVCVEIHEVRCVNGYCIDDVDVWVAHEDSKHDSPLLTEAIRKALPDWWTIKREVEQRMTA